MARNPVITGKLIGRMALGVGLLVTSLMASGIELSSHLSNSGESVFSVRSLETINLSWG